MLSPRWRKVQRDVGQHKGRTLLVVLAMAAGLAEAGVILNAWALVEVATRDGYLASNPASATLRVDSVDATLLARVAAHPDIRQAQGRRTTYTRAQVGATWFTAMLFTVEDFEDVHIGVIRAEAGVWPPDDGGLVIERSSLDFTGAAVGEEIRLALGDDAPVGVTVRGAARDVGLAPGWMEHVLYGFVTRATLERLKAPSALTELQIVVRDGALGQEGIRRVAYDVRRDIESMGRRVTDVEVPVPGEHVHAAQMDSLLYTQGAFALMALLLSAFLVVNLVAAMLAGQTREIGVLKTLGARWEQIAAMYLSAAALLGVIAVAIALPIALVGGRAYASVKGDLLNFDIRAFDVPLGVVVLQLVVGICIPVLAASVPVWRGCRIAVNDALRDVGISQSASSGALAQRVTGLSRPILLSLRNAFRRRQRLVLTLLALATGGAVFLGANNLRLSVLGATDLLFSAQRYDFVLRFSGPQDIDSVERVVRGVAGVRDAEAWSGARATVDHGDGTLGNSFTISAPPAATRLLAVTVESGRWLGAGDGRVLVVNRALAASDSSLAVGRSVTLLLAGAPSVWTVVGIAESGTAPSAFAPREALAPLVAEGRVSSVVVASDYSGEGSTFDLIQRLRATLEEGGQPVASSQLVAESRRVVEDHLLMVVDFLGAVAWLMLLVGGMGLASTMSLAVLERTREIGVLRAIGARHGSIFTLIEAEGLTIALLSWGVAIPLSIPMSVILAEAFGRIMMRIPITYVPDLTGVAVWLALVVGVSVVACAWPALRAMRVPTAAALAYE